jgi:AAA family ATP:ADP antiporter
VLWAAAWFFFVLSSYFPLRSLREAFGIQDDLARLPWLFLATLLVMLLANPLYGALVSRLPRRVFIDRVHHFFALNMIVLAGLLLWPRTAGSPWLGKAFYVWVSVFNLFINAVFWSRLVDGFSAGQGKRLYGRIGVGGTLGAIAGAWGATQAGGLAGALALEVETIHALFPLLSAALLEAGLLCEHRLARSSGADARAAAREAQAEEARIGGRALDGLREIARSPYLGGISTYLLLGTITGTLLYFAQAAIVKGLFATRGEQVDAFARIDLWAQTATLGIQVVLTAPLIRLLGIGRTLALLPLVSVAGFGALWVLPTFATLAVVQVVRRGVQYALAKPAREVLFSPLSRSEKYKAKTAIDTFVYRTGDALGAGAQIGMKALGAVAHAGPLAIFLSLAWTGTAFGLGRAHRRRAAGRVPGGAGARSE